MDINSLIFFRSHWAVWRILGLTPNQMKRKHLYIAYSIILHLIVTLAYPLHLCIALLRNANLVDDIRNLTISSICLACTLKFVIYAYNFDKVDKMETLLAKLDSRVKTAAEINIFSQLKTQLRTILYVFLGVYLLIGVFSELMFVFQDERGLMYPAWFPFDWLHSTRNFYIANIYQFVGVGLQLLQNYTNDCYPTVVLCLISAHIKMLHIRFEQIGVDNTGDADANDQLEACITDHKILLELFQTMESFMSIPMLIQFAVTALNVCISIAALLFFVTAPMARSYFFFYAMGIALEIFPTCYYGTDNEFWFGELHYAAFSCNWVIQNRSFKKKLMLFVERSLKENTPMAGGMLRIHVTTFLSTLKFAYSLFTILIQMQK